MTTRGRDARRGLLAIACCAPALLLACGTEGPTGTKAKGGSAAAATAATDAAQAAGSGSATGAAAKPVAKASAAATAAAAPACGAGAHARHAAENIACAICHPCGGEFGLALFTYPRGTSTANMTLTPPATGSPASCSGGCHSPLGAPTHVITWPTPGPLDCTACHDVTTLPSGHPAVLPTFKRADCLQCHQETGHTTGEIVLVGHQPGWMDLASAGFHAFSADRGLQPCEACHAPDLSGNAAAHVPACGQCHDVGLPTGVASWRVNCVMCHGGVDNPTGAPPKALWGYAGDPQRGNGTADPLRVGAHTRHVAPGPFAGAFPCGTCHVVPPDALAAGHIDETAGIPYATVNLTGLAVAPTTPPPLWDRPSASCTSVYCHGATLAGGSAVAPVWTTSPAQCDWCHGIPPPPPHFAVPGGPPACNGCHPGTVLPDGTIDVAGGLHVNGKTDVTGGGCTACHGDKDRTPAGIAPAPPRGTHGETATTQPAVGAHLRHLVAGVLRGPIPCTECHAVPGDLAHAAQPLNLTWGPLATAKGAVPIWDPAAYRCSNYCHGAKAGGGTNKTPLWIEVDGTQAACGTCHGLPPKLMSTGRMHPADLGGITTCWVCHPMNSDGTIDLTTQTHINGMVDIW